jgi:hypothetical protein
LPNDAVFRVTIGHDILSINHGNDKKIITKEDAIKALFGDNANDMVLFLLDAIKDPFLSAIMFTSVIEYKERHKDLYDKTGDASKS